MIQSWRIVHQDYAATAFDGEGARRTGGRWNSEGIPVVYTAGTLSLALLEIIVHLEIKTSLQYFKAIPVTFSPCLMTTISSEKLPPEWHVTPPSFEPRSLGDSWVQQAVSAILCVPSAVVPNENNYLLNPNHTDFAKIEIGQTVDLPADPRIIQKLK